MIDQATGEPLPGIAPLPMRTAGYLLLDPAGGVFVGAWDAPLARIDANGQRDSAFQPSIRAQPLGVNGNPVLVAPLLQPTGLQLLDRTSGALVGPPIEAGSGSVRAWAGVGDGTVLVALDTALVRVDARSGDIRWRYAGGQVAVAASNGRAFAAAGPTLNRIDLDRQPDPSPERPSHLLRILLHRHRVADPER